MLVIDSHRCGADSHGRMGPLYPVNVLKRPHLVRLSHSLACTTDQSFVFKLKAYFDLTFRRQCIEVAADGCLALIQRGNYISTHQKQGHQADGRPPPPLDPLQPESGLGMLERFASTAQVSIEMG